MKASISLLVCTITAIAAWSQPPEGHPAGPESQEKELMRLRETERDLVERLALTRSQISVLERAFVATGTDRVTLDPEIVAVAAMNKTVRATGSSGSRRTNGSKPTQASAVPAARLRASARGSWQ